MIKVNCEVETYNDGLEFKKDMPKLHIKNHWNRRNMVWIEVNGEKHLVVGNDLMEAIRNCMNTK